MNKDILVIISLLLQQFTELVCKGLSGLFAKAPFMLIHNHIAQIHFCYSLIIFLDISNYAFSIPNC